MPGLLVKDGAIMVRNSGVVVGTCPDCCGGIAPAGHYYRFEACPSGGGDPCGLPSVLPGLQTIYVSEDLLCSNTGQTIKAMVVAALTANLTPVIRWGGWCYSFADSCYFPVCPAPGSPCGVTCKVLPPNAVGPSGPVVCVTGCDAPVCLGPAYVFLQPCPGEGTIASPELYICLSDLYAFFAAGGRCPVYRIENQCFYADWQNASATKPANYSRLQSSPSFDGCCSCLGPPCVYSEGHGCLNVGGFTGMFDPPGAFAPRCCAHALRGTAFLSWDFVQREGGTVNVRKFGQVSRSGLTYAGAWTRVQRIGPGQYVTETFPVAGSFAASSHFSLLSTIGADTLASIAEKTWAGFPCPIGDFGSTFAGTWRSTCKTFSMNATVRGFADDMDFSVAYQCSPDPAECEAGCADDRLKKPTDPKKATTPIGPGPPDSLPEFGPLLEALA